MIAALEGFQIIALQPALCGFARQGPVQSGEQHRQILRTTETGIAALPVQYDLSDLGRRLRQQVVGNRHRIADGVIQPPNDVSQPFDEMGGTNFQPAVIGPIAIHHQLHEIIFPLVFLAEMHRESRESGFGPLSGGDGQHRAGIDAARQKHRGKPVWIDRQTVRHRLFQRIAHQGWIIVNRA